jgi:hypothetical protein
LRRYAWWKNHRQDVEEEDDATEEVGNEGIRVFP